MIQVSPFSTSVYSVKKPANKQVDKASSREMAVDSPPMKESAFLSATAFLGLQGVKPAFTGKASPSLEGLAQQMEAKFPQLDVSDAVKNDLKTQFLLAQKMVEYGENNYTDCAKAEEDLWAINGAIPTDALNELLGDAGNYCDMEIRPITDSLNDLSFLEKMSPIGREKLLESYNLYGVRKVLQGGCVDYTNCIKNSGYFEPIREELSAYADILSDRINKIGLSEPVKKLVDKAKEDHGINLDMPNIERLAPLVDEYLDFFSHPTLNLSLPKYVSFNNFDKGQEEGSCLFYSPEFVEGLDDFWQEYLQRTEKVGEGVFTYDPGNIHYFMDEKGHITKEGQRRIFDTLTHELDHYQTYKNGTDKAQKAAKEKVSAETFEALVNGAFHKPEDAFYKEYVRQKPHEFFQVAAQLKHDRYYAPPVQAYLEKGQASAMTDRTDLLCQLTDKDKYSL